MHREDLGNLAMFSVVAEEKSFTRAATKLGVSQSALNHPMRRLEAKLGLRLLSRTTRSVAPTEAGERLMETLRPALDEIDAKVTSLTELREKPAGMIRITMLPLVAAGTMVRVLEDWCEPFDGYYLYYASRRQPSPAFTLLLDALRFRV